MGGKILAESRDNMGFVFAQICPPLPPSYRVPLREGPVSFYWGASNIARRIETRYADVYADFAGASQHAFFPRFFKVRFVFPPFALGFTGMRSFHNKKHAQEPGAEHKFQFSANPCHAQLKKTARSVSTMPS